MRRHRLKNGLYELNCMFASGAQVLDKDADRPNMSAPGYPRIDRFKTAYLCHVGLGVIVCLSLAMQVHLSAIAAAPEVAAAGFFIVAVFLGLPAILISVPAIYFSLKAGDRWLMSLVAIWVVLACAVILSASPGFTITDRKSTRLNSSH